MRSINILDKRIYDALDSDNENQNEDDLYMTVDQMKKEDPVFKEYYEKHKKNALGTDKVDPNVWKLVKKKAQHVKTENSLKVAEILLSKPNKTKTDTYFAHSKHLNVYEENPESKNLTYKTKTEDT